MRVTSFFLTIILFSCNSSEVQEESKMETRIYLDAFKASGFSYDDFIKLQETSNTFPERLDTIPNDLALRLSSQDTSNVTFLCSWIDTTEIFPLGAFEIRGKSFANEFFVTFSQRGDPIDYLVFKGATFKIQNNQIIYYKDFTEVTFYACNDCYPLVTEYFAVKIIDTSDITIHPHVAKALRTDNWYINENGMFELKK